MAIITLATSLADVDANAGYEALPVGQYTTEVETVEIKTGPKGDYMNLRLNVIEPTEFAGKKLFDTISFSEEAKARHKQFRLAGNLDGNVQTFDTDDYIGLTIECVVKHENKKAKDETGQYAIVIGADGTPEKKAVIARYIFN
jgi:hypothetical protein